MASPITVPTMLRWLGLPTALLLALLWFSQGRSAGLFATTQAGFVVGGDPRGHQYFVSPDGEPQGTGTLESPWDIASALSGKQRVQPGDTLWLRGGTYKATPVPQGQGFVVKLTGTRDAPIHVRAYRGERVTVDGGLSVQSPSNHLWIWDLEIIVSEPRPKEPTPRSALTRPWGGLNIISGTGCKYINLVVHDNCQGISFWRPAKDSEIHGCLIYDNGWKGPDRGHGHGIYTQNSDGVKTISDCILTGGFGYSIHGYGEKASVNNYQIEGNICYSSGFFLVGGYLPSRGIKVLRNCVVNSILQLGYLAPENEDCEVRENVVVGGDLVIKNYRKVVQVDNLVVKPNEPRPLSNRVFFRRNKYDPHRANIGVFNWEHRPAVEVDVGGFLKAGDRYRLLNPRDFFGRPILTGSYDGRPLRIAMSAATEFAAFVLRREPVADAR